MNVGQRAVRNPEAFLIQIERCGYELADLIPVVRQIEQGAVDGDQENRDRSVSDQVDLRP